MSLTKIFFLILFSFASRAFGFDLTLEYAPIYHQGYSKSITVTCPEDHIHSFCFVHKRKLGKKEIASMVEDILKLEQELTSLTSSNEQAKSLRISYSSSSKSFKREFGVFGGETSMEKKKLRSYHQLVLQLRRKLREAR